MTDIQLIIICAQEREDKPGLGSAFARYKIDKPTLPPVAFLSQKIEELLKHPADPQRSENTYIKRILQQNI